MIFRITIFAILTNFALRAETAPSGLIVGLETIPNRISSHNPELAAARWKIREAEARLSGAGLLDNPELEAGVTQGSDTREHGVEVGLFQRFPVTNRLALEKQLSAAELAEARAEVGRVERDLIVEARTRLINVISLRNQQALRERQAEIAEQLAGFIADAASRGELSSLDAGQAKLDSARLRGEIPALRAAETAASGEVKRLLGMSPSDTLHIAGNSLPSPELPGEGISYANNPDYQAARLATESASNSVRLEEAKRYDDVEVGLVAGLDHAEDAPDGYENEGMVGFRVKLALPFWQKNESAIAEARARTSRREQETTAVVETIRHQTATVREEMATWASLLSNIDNELLPLARKQAKDSDKAYREGLGDLQSALRAREQEMQINRNRLDALEQFHLARIRYEAAAGTN